MRNAVHGPLFAARKALCCESFDSARRGRVPCRVPAEARGQTEHRTCSFAVCACRGCLTRPALRRVLLRQFFEHNEAQHQTVQHQQGSTCVVCIIYSHFYRIKSERTQKTESRHLLLPASKPSASRTDHFRIRHDKRTGSRARCRGPSRSGASPNLRRSFDILPGCSKARAACRNRAEREASLVSAAKRSCQEADPSRAHTYLLCRCRVR